MNYKEIVNIILDFIPTVDFTTTRKENETISLFESTIRYIGGLLSGRLQLRTVVNSKLLTTSSL